MSDSSYTVFMSHHTARESFRKLSERINRFPQGAPPTDLLFQILEVLFTPAEAELVALLPIKPFTAETAARLWKKSETEARKILEALASRGMMLDIDSHRGQTFVMPPPMAGFFEFSMMRIGDHYDQKLLAELFYQYLNVEEDFIKALFATGETQIGRAFINESVLSGGKHTTRARLRTRLPGSRNSVAHRCRHLLLPTQGVASESQLRSADGYLYDLQFHGKFAAQARHRPARG